MVEHHKIRSSSPFILIIEMFQKSCFSKTLMKIMILGMEVVNIYNNEGVGILHVLWNYASMCNLLCHGQFAVPIAS